MLAIREVILFVGRRLKRFFIYRVLSLDDSPHRIALGVAIGVFICWTPTIPCQMILTVAISTLIGANRFVGVPFVWISNPVTMWPIFGSSYYLGEWMLGGKFRSVQFLREMSFSANPIEIAQTFWQAIWHIFWPLWLGSVIAGLVLAVLTYFATYRAVVVFRRHRKHHHRHDKEEAQTQIP